MHFELKEKFCIDIYLSPLLTYLHSVCYLLIALNPVKFKVIKMLTL